MGMSVAVVPGLFVAVAAAGWDEFIENGGHISFEAWLELDRADSSRTATLNMFTIPVLMPDELTAAATSSVRSCMSPWPLVWIEICF